MFALANQVEPMTSQHHLPAACGPSDQQRSIRLLPQAAHSGMWLHHLPRQHWTPIKVKQKHPARKIAPVMIYFIILLQAQSQLFYISLFNYVFWKRNKELFMLISGQDVERGNNNKRRGLFFSSAQRIYFRNKVWTKIKMQIPTKLPTRLLG